MKEEKMSFWTRVKTAVFKLEDYEKFAFDKTTSSVKYFFLIVLLLSLVLTVISTDNISKMLNKGIKYVKNELPEFSYSDGKLNFDEYVESYDNEYGMSLIADTSSDITTDRIEEYENKILNDGFIFLENKLIYVNGENKLEYSYADIASEYNVSNLNKTDLVTKIDAIGSTGITVVIAMVFFISEYIAELITIFLDWVVMAIFAWCVSKICRLSLTFKNDFNMSIYALTLSILLGMAYNIANYFWGFYTEYFRAVYLLISYVYIISAIFMMKSDIIKQEEEIQEIKKEQEKIHKEMQEKQDEENKENDDKQEDDAESKEKKDNNNDENSENKEPDGSEI